MKFGAMRAAFRVASILVVMSGSATAEKDIPPLPQWAQLCGSDFVSFAGRRWLLSSNAKDKTQIMDEWNIWTVQKRSIKSVRAFEYGDGLRAFVALDLGEHRLSNKGKPIDIVISGTGYARLIACFSQTGLEPRG